MYIYKYKKFAAKIRELEIEANRATGECRKLKAALPG
jgi:hypothetical protein